MKKKLNCVLLIDDDEPTNYLSRMKMENANCANHIQIASSGQEALNYLTNSERFACSDSSFPCPDLIFLDINMPAMNGWEFLEKYAILEKEHKGNIVMVMLSTSLNPDDRSKATGMSHISGFESKPLTAQKLDSILRKFFPDNF